MSIEWGAWEYSGGNGMRVGLEVTWESIAHSETVATATIKVHTENQFAYSDGQTLSYSGSISGSQGFTNNDGGAPVLRDTLTYDYTYSASSYGTSPGDRTFTALLSGAYNGVTPSKSVTSEIPARPYAAPAAPTGLSVTRVSDTSTKVSWTNHPTAGEPYTTLRLERSTDGGANWALVGNLSGSATSYTNGAAVNNKYRYRIRAENNAGSSAYATSVDIYTTPNSPTNPARAGANGANQSLTWVNKSGYTEFQTEIWRSINGTYTLLDTVAYNYAQPYIDTYPATHASDRFKYKFRHKTTSGGQGVLYSSYTADTTETSGTTSPPNAPTGLSPDDTTIDPTNAQDFQWTHVPTDASAETAYELQYRESGTTNWTTVTTAATNVSGHTWKVSITLGVGLNNKIIEWQVRTKGSDPAFGPWSPSAVFDTAYTPIAPDPVKIPMMLDLFTGKVEASSSAFEQRDFITRSQAQLFGGGLRAVDASYNISWSQRFICIGYGRSSNTFPNGHHDILNPYGWNCTNKVLTSNMATLTITTTNPNRMRTGDYIIVSGVGAPFDGTWLVESTTTNTVTYKCTASNVASASATGAVFPRIQGHGGASDTYPNSAKTTLPAWGVLYYELPFGWGAGTTPRKNGVVSVTNKALTSNVATLTVVAPHYFAVGDRVNISIGDAVFDGSDKVITGLTATTISYAKTNANVASTTTSGYAQPSGKDTFWGNFHIVSYTEDFVVPSNWIALAMRNNDASTVEWATGESVDPGYDTDTYNIGGQKIKKLNIGTGSGTTDANGQIQFNHGLGQTPSQVLVSKSGSGGPHTIGNVGSYTSTTFQVTFRNLTNGGAVSASGATVSVVFLAIAE